MPIRATVVLLLLFLLAFGATAGAQPYVGGAVYADIVRASNPDDQPGSGE